MSKPLPEQEPETRPIGSVWVKYNFVVDAAFAHIASGQREPFLAAVEAEAFQAVDEAVRYKPEQAILDSITRLTAENAALRADLLLARQGRAWQPIATAPKDGTPILVLADDGERFVGCWKRGGWELFGAYARIHPVHAWMPLPDPPVAASLGGTSADQPEEEK